MRQTVQRVHTVWVDGSSDDQPFYQWAIETLRWMIWVILRPEAAQGSVLSTLEQRLQSLARN